MADALRDTIYLSWERLINTSLPVGHETSISLLNTQAGQFACCLENTNEAGKCSVSLEINNHYFNTNILSVFSISESDRYTFHFYWQEPHIDVRSSAELHKQLGLARLVYISLLDSVLTSHSNSPYGQLSPQSSETDEYWDWNGHRSQDHYLQ